MGVGGGGEVKGKGKGKVHVVNMETFVMKKSPFFTYM